MHNRALVAVHSPRMMSMFCSRCGLFSTQYLHNTFPLHTTVAMVMHHRNLDLMDTRRTQATTKNFTRPVPNETENVVSQRANVEM